MCRTTAILFRVLCGACSLATVLSIAVNANELPGEALRVIDEYQKQLEAVDGSRDSVVKTAVTEGMKALGDIQKRLTRQKQLDQAVIVRTLLQALEQIEATTARLEVLRDEVGFKRPTECKPAIDAILAVDKAAQESADAERLRIRNATIGDLEEILSQLAEQEKLDECIAVRNAINDLKGTGPDLEEDLEPLKLTDLKSKQWVIKRECQTELKPAFAKLRMVLEGLVRDRSEYEEWISTMSLLQTLIKEGYTARKINHVRLSTEAVLPDARGAVRECLAAIDVSVAKRDAALSELQQAVVDVDESEWRAAILDWDTERALNKQSQFERAGKSNIFGTYVRAEIPSDLPKLPHAAGMPFESHDQRVDMIDDEFNQAAAKSRNSFMARLNAGKQSRELRDDQKEVIEVAMTYLNLPACHKLDHLRLFPIYLELPGQVRASQFMVEIDDLINDRKIQRDASRESLRIELLPQVEAGVGNRQYVEAMAILLRWNWLDHRFHPVPVMAADRPSRGLMMPAFVIDVVGNSCLVRFESERNSAWHPRRLVRIDGEAQRERFSDLAVDWREDDRFSPGRKVVRIASVKSGQRVFCLRSKLWALATIHSVAVGQAEVSWADQPESKPTKVDWSLVRLVE